uniref:G-protein coupled receptors family 1 profile domain-containing protein n=1 Tax=Panagrolaimus superbus TaxID=310955 RepID=A0A914YBE7_9BILA
MIFRLCLNLAFISTFVWLLKAQTLSFPDEKDKISIKSTRLKNVKCLELKFAWTQQLRYVQKELFKVVNQSIVEFDMKDFFNKNNTYCVGSADNECSSNEENKNDETQINHQPQIGSEILAKDSGPDKCVKNHRNFFYRQIFVCERFPIKKESDVEPNEAQLDFLKDYMQYTVLRYCNNLNLDKEKRYLQNFIDFLFILRNTPRFAVCDTVEIEKEQKEDCFENQSHDNIAHMCHSADPKDMSESFFTYFYDKIDANNTADKVLKDFDELSYNMITIEAEDIRHIIDKLANVVKQVPEIKTQMKVLEAINIPLSRELMISNLLLNSYGKALRNAKKRLNAYCKETSPKMTTNLKQFEPECMPESLWQRTPYTLGITDFDDLIMYENIRIVLRILLLVISLFVNAYTFFVVKASALDMPYISSKLIQLLLIANFLFIVTDFFVILDSFFPFAPQDEYMDFIAMTNFDGDLWENVTYYVNMETVRNTLYYRYDGKEGIETEASFASTWANINIILQTFLLNISRTYSAIILLSVVCYVLYELRNSFGGRLSKKTTLCFKLTLAFCFVVVTAGYVIAGILQYFVIDYINQAMKSENRTVICEQVTIKSYQIRIHTYMMTAFYILSSLATFIVFAYHKLHEIVAPVDTKELKIEMRSTLISLGVATAVYIFSNFFTTYTELALTLGSSEVDNITIATLTTWYQWLYLASFADPIIHPFILIYRIKAMRLIHQHWKKQITSFSLSDYFVSFVVYVHQYPQRRRMKKDYKRFKNSSKASFPAITNDTMRHRHTRIHSFQLDHDVNSMLDILAKQKNPSYML